MTKVTRILATNAAKVVELGFAPDAVRIRNLTNLYEMEWSKPMSDSYRVLQLAIGDTPGNTAKLDVIATIVPGSNLTNIEFAWADLGSTGAISVAATGAGTPASPLRFTISMSDDTSDNTALIAGIEAISHASVSFRAIGADTTNCANVTAWAYLDQPKAFSVAQCGLVTGPTDGAVINPLAPASETALPNTGIKAIDGSDKVNYTAYSYGFVLGACANINDTTTEILEITATRSDL